MAAIFANQLQPWEEVSFVCLHLSNLSHPGASLW
jgi:hypothetical protein